MTHDVAQGGAAHGVNLHHAVGHRGVDRPDVWAWAIPEREQISDGETLDGLGEILRSDLYAHAVSLRPALHVGTQ